MHPSEVVIDLAKYIYQVSYDMTDHQIVVVVPLLQQMVIISDLPTFHPPSPRHQCFVQNQRCRAIMFDLGLRQVMKGIDNSLDSGRITPYQYPYPPRRSDAIQIKVVSSCNVCTMCRSTVSKTISSKKYHQKVSSHLPWLI